MFPFDDVIKHYSIPVLLITAIRESRSSFQTTLRRHIFQTIMKTYLTALRQLQQGGGRRYCAAQMMYVRQGREHKDVATEISETTLSVGHG